MDYQYLFCFWGGNDTLENVNVEVYILTIDIHAYAYIYIYIYICVCIYTYETSLKADKEDLRRGGVNY